MSKFHSNWRQFLTEGKDAKQKLIFEVEEEEIELIRSAIDDLESEDLPFDKLFKGKRRVLIPLPTLDDETDTGKFLRFLTRHHNGDFIKSDSFAFSPNFETGMMSREMPIADDKFIDFVMNRNPPPPRYEKMKIGKYLGAAERLIDNFIKLQPVLLKRADGEMSDEKTEAVIAKLHDTMFKLFYTKSLLMVYAKMGLYDQVSSVDGFENPMGRLKIAIVALPKAKEFIQEMRAYWQKNAEFLKKNPEGETNNNKFSIILSRHPLDILRMSDFRNIQSCHSPPSRGGGASYFKCAVAEARGEGAIAYVVKTEDLEDIDLDDYEPSYAGDPAERELFYDDARGVGEIEPVSRIRLRLVRRYDTDTPKRYDEGDDIAVPENRIYGLKIPELTQKMMHWAAENQKETLDNFHYEQVSDVRGGGLALDMSRFIKFGGSYEDTDTQQQLLKLAGVLATDNITPKGRIQINTDVEDNTVVDTYERQAQTFQEMAESHVEDADLSFFTVNVNTDYDEGSAWIEPDIYVSFVWDEEDFIKMPNSVDLRYMQQELEDYGPGYDWLSGYRMYAGRKLEPESKIYLRFVVDVSKIYREEVPYFYDTGEFEQFLEELQDVENNRYETVKEILSQLLSREGYMEGGELINLGNAVQSGDKDLYEWDWNVEEGYDNPFELITATTRQIIDHTKIPGATEEKVNLILKSRDFWLEIRKRMHEPIHDRYENKYFVDIERVVRGVDDSDFDFDMSYFVGEDDRDTMVEIFSELVEYWDDEDNLHALFKTVMAEFIKKVDQSASDTKPATNTNEHKIKTTSNKKLFNNWRKFLQES